MKFLFIVSVVIINRAICNAQGEFTTINPKVDRSAVRQVIITRVELTKQFTILFMKYTGDGSGSGDIRFVPTARLLTDEGKRIYKYIRAENITEYTNRHVALSEQVDFVVYFQRIDPGFTFFDLYECNNIEVQGDCWNFSGIHITNPSSKELSSSKLANAGSSKGIVEINQTKNGLTTAITSKEKLNSITGTIRNHKSNQPLAAVVTLIKLSPTNQVQSNQVHNIGSSGVFTIPNLLPGNYLVSTVANGYFSQSDTVTVRQTDIIHNINLVMIEVGARIELKNIFFNASKSDLTVDSFLELDKLVRILKLTPTINIRLEGHTDIIGDFDANVLLARNRVNEVKKYLINKGIAEERIKTISYGPTNPINKNKSLKERPENRRVELVVLKV